MSAAVEESPVTVPTTRPGDPLGSTVAEFSEQWVEVEEGVALRVLRWRPRQATGRRPLVLVAGWISVVEGWLDLLEALAAERDVIYVESREKATARITRPLVAEDFRIPRLAEDLRALWNELELEAVEPVVFASSMGSNAILEALKGEGLAIHGAFLIGPNATFHFPWWGHLVVRMPISWYHAAKRPIMWYLRHFRVNAAEDPEQMERYERTLHAADPARLKLSAQAVIGYSALEGLETVTAPVAVAYAESDTLHGAEAIAAIVERLPRGRGVSCPSNTYMHTAAVAADLEAFLDELEVRP